MKQILIATHGKMASGIRYTAELIVGKMDEITTIDAYVTPEDNVEKKFEEYFAQHENDRIFVFTDLMGGSVNQKLLGYSQKENVTLITGTNLPVLMQVMMADDDVTEEEIQAYVASKEPMDKAGSYGIQGRWGIYVKGICGDYNNVVGLPVARLFHEMKKLGISLVD